MASPEIVSAMQTLSTPDKLRQDTQIIMQPHANWEKYLIPAPMSIAVLGQLAFISAKEDFSVNKNPPKEGFKYIEYPESFRATLMQVCHAGWEAFNEAHTSMDQIRLHTANVPNYVKKAVQVILSDDERLFKAVLPNILQTIDNMVSECLSLSKSTKSKFHMVRSLIEEVLKASLNANQAYNVDLKDVERLIEESEIRRKANEEAEKKTNEELKKLKANVDAAERKFQKALESMPSGFKVIGMNLVEGLADTAVSFLDGAANLMTLNLGKMFGRGGGGQQSEGSGEERMTQYFASREIFGKTSLIVKMTEALVKMTRDKPIDWKKLCDEQTKKPMTDSQKCILEDTLYEISSVENCDAKQEALDICKDAIAVCTKLAEIIHQGSCEDEELMMKEIATVHEKAQAFNSKGKKLLNTSGLTQKAPGMSRAQAKGKKGSEIEVENSRIRIEETRRALEEARSTLQKAEEESKEQKNEMTEILIKLKNCDLQQIDFKTTLEVLRQGLKALGNVEEQWKKMVRFFEMITNIISTSMHTYSKTFLHDAEQSSLYSSNTFLKDAIYHQSFQVANVAQLVHMISSTYTNVSNKYIMDQVASLGRLMTLEHGSEQLNLERKKLQDGCDKAQVEISALVQKNMQDFNRKTEDRIAQLEELKALLPPPTEDEEQKIKRITEVPASDLDISQFI